MKDEFIFRCETHNEDETHLLGCALANVIKRGDVILLTGDLAAGKTTISRSIFSSKGYTEGFCSPTFAVINEYKKENDCAYHMDLYRISDSEELEYTGFFDCIENGEFCVIEWPEIAKGLIHNDIIDIDISHSNEENSRVFIIKMPDRERLDKLKEVFHADSCD